jgi:hypothetical protein
VAFFHLASYSSFNNEKAEIFFRNSTVNSPPSWGFDVPLATALGKTFLLRMLNDS